MVSYTYITASIEEAKLAWLEFNVEKSQSGWHVSEVHFIPAAGGCFIVARVGRVRSRLLDWLLRVPRGKGPEYDCSQCLDAFAVFWTHSRAQKVVTA